MPNELGRDRNIRSSCPGCVCPRGVSPPIPGMARSSPFPSTVSAQPTGSGFPSEPHQHPPSSIPSSLLAQATAAFSQITLAPWILMLLPIVHFQICVQVQENPSPLPTSSPHSLMLLRTQRISTTEGADPV